MTSLALGDIAVICQYQKVYGEYKQYAEESYSDVQALPVVYITPKSGKNGVKVTIQQTAGTLRAFAHCFFKELMEAALPPKPKARVQI